MSLTTNELADQCSDFHSCYGVPGIFLAHIQVPASLICCLMELEGPSQGPAFSLVLQIFYEALNSPHALDCHH
jgi:hypothetical protein